MRIETSKGKREAARLLLERFIEMQTKISRKILWPHKVTYSGRCEHGNDSGLIRQRIFSVVQCRKTIVRKEV